MTAPSGKVDQGRLELGLQYLRDQGIAYEVGETCSSEFRYLAGKDALRAREFEDAWCRDDLDAVLCARGGYGAMRLFPLLDWERMKAYENVLLGHSDVTALHCAFASKGLSPSVSSVMVAAEMARKKDSLTAKTLQASLSLDARYDFFSACDVTIVKPGVARGRLYPVTLSVLTYLLHTEFLPDFTGAILCVEDVNEATYKLDCFFTQLEQAGVLSQLGGLILGDFTGALEEDGLSGLENEVANKVAGPVLRVREFGHCLPRLNLPFNREVELFARDAKKVSLRLSKGA